MRHSPTYPSPRLFKRQILESVTLAQLTVHEFPLIDAVDMSQEFAETVVDSVSLHSRVGMKHTLDPSWQTAVAFLPPSQSASTRPSEDHQAPAIPH